MKLRRAFSPLALAVAMMTPLAAAQTPPVREIYERSVAALGGDGYPSLGILRLEVSSEETRNDGTASKDAYTIYVDTSEPTNLRLELEGDIVVGRNGDSGWATVGGEIDERPQTSYMAKTTLNQRLFPLLPPYSLKMDGVWMKEAGEVSWEGRQAWAVLMPFAKGFFKSPVLTTDWRLVVSKEDYTILGMDFVPPVEYRDVQPMGMRYRYLKWDEIDGVKIPSQVLAVGINSQGIESGAHRITKVAISKFGQWQPRLFMSPQQLEALEGED
jgi:hypothetical protein